MKRRHLIQLVSSLPLISGGGFAAFGRGKPSWYLEPSERSSRSEPFRRLGSPAKWIPLNDPTVDWTQRTNSARWFVNNLLILIEHIDREDDLMVERIWSLASNLWDHGANFDIPTAIIAGGPAVTTANALIAMIQSGDIEDHVEGLEPWDVDTVLRNNGLGPQGPIEVGDIVVQNAGGLYEVTGLEGRDGAYVSYGYCKPLNRYSRLVPTSTLLKVPASVPAKDYKLRYGDVVLNISDPGGPRCVNGYNGYLDMASNTLIGVAASSFIYLGQSPRLEVIFDDIEDPYSITTRRYPSSV